MGNLPENTCEKTYIGFIQLSQKNGWDVTGHTTKLCIIYIHMHIHADQSSHDLGLSKKEEHHQMASLINGANDDKSDKII